MHAFPYIFPFFFVAIWLFISFMLSRSGWREFANRYPAPNQPDGKIYQCRKAQFNDWCRYDNGVRIILTDAGVYFSVFLPIRAFHPPFLLPWESIKRMQRKKILFWNYIQIDVEDSAGKICALLPTSIEEELLRYSRQTSQMTLDHPA